MVLDDVDGFRFEFPDRWQAGKFDAWVFYREQFSRMWDGIKAVDVLATAPDGTLWLIEVKDYTRHPRTKAIALHHEVAQKTFDTLAALLPARANASEAGEIALALSALATRRIRVVLVLAQPNTQGGLFPRAIDPANVKLALRGCLKAIDPHPLVVDPGGAPGVPWSVRPAVRGA